MVKLKVSYKDPAELSALLAQIRGNVVNVKIPQTSKGRFRLAYIYLEYKGDETDPDE